MAERKWQFRTMFRARAYGWRGSRLAISRLKEAASEIKAAAKSDPVAAGDGAVSLMERIWRRSPWRLSCRPKARLLLHDRGQGLGPTARAFLHNQDPPPDSEDQTGP